MGALELQVGDGVVFAHYLPPNAGPNNGGCPNRVFAGGSFLGVGYDQLLALGTGSHTVLADERAGCREDEEARKRVAEDQAAGRLRWALFLYQVGACTEGEVLFEALHAMTPGCIAQVARELPQAWQARLAAFAAGIPTYRARGGVRSIASGRVTQVPDENLVALRQWFEDQAEQAAADVTDNAKSRPG